MAAWSERQEGVRKSVQSASAKNAPFAGKGGVEGDDQIRTGVVDPYTSEAPSDLPVSCSKQGFSPITSGISDGFDPSSGLTEANPDRPCEWCDSGTPGARYHDLVPDLWVCDACSRPLQPVGTEPLLPLKPWRLEKPGYVYFIQEGKRGPVKIGWAAHPAERIVLLQTGNPRRLYLVKKIACSRPYYERELHRHFADCRITREWFTRAVLELDVPTESEVFA